MSKIENNNKRPNLITAVCILSFIGILISVLYELKIGKIESPILLFVSLFLQFIGTVGLWKMKQLGALLYVGVIVTKTILLMLRLSEFNIIYIVPSIIIIIIIYNNFEKMEYNKKITKNLTE